MKKLNPFLFLSSLLAFALPGGAEEAKPPVQPAEPATVSDIRIIIKTVRGDIHGTIFASKVPLTSANFLNLAQRGYYDGITFHRVIPDFMIQGGDPTGTGSGGPGYKFEDETDRSLKHNVAGVFSMANADPGGSKEPYSNKGRTNGSQFFITHLPTPWLDGLHTVFGKVTEGQSVVDAIKPGDKIEKIEILDATEALFASQAKRLKEWNAILDK